MSLLAVILSNAVVASLLGLMAFAAHRWARRPFLGHALAVLALVKLLTPPLLPLSLGEAPWPVAAAEATQTAHSLPTGESAPRPVTTGVSASGTEAVPALTARAATSRPSAQPVLPEPPVATPAPEPAPQRPWLLMIWGVGSLLLAGLTVMRVSGFRRALRSSRPASEAVQREVRDLGDALHLRRLPEVRVVDARLSPMLWAFSRRPKILLPEGLVSRLDDAERRTLLAHELTHYRRRDHWVRHLELVATALYWWLPTLWWGRRLLHQVEEQCCDARVLAAFPGAGRSYARALLETLDFLAGVPRRLPPAACGMASGPFLRSRVMMILEDHGARSLTGAGRGTILVLAAVLLPLLPTFGEPQEAPEPIRTTPFRTEVARVGDAVITEEHLWDHLLASKFDTVMKLLEQERAAEMLAAQRGIVPDEDAVVGALKEAIVTRAPGESIESLAAKGDSRLAALRRTASTSALWQQILGERAENKMLAAFLMRQELEAFTMHRAVLRRRTTSRGLPALRFESAGALQFPAGVAAVVTLKGDVPTEKTISVDDARRTAALLSSPAERDRAVETLIRIVAINQAGIAADVGVTATEVEAWVAAQNEKYQPPFTWVQITRIKGTTPEREAMRWRDVTLWKRIARHESSEEELDAFAAANRPFFSGAHRKVSHILVRVGASSQEKLSEAEALARTEMIGRKIREGQDFHRVAEKFSEDAVTAKGGGRLAMPVKQRDKKLDPAFAAAVWKLRSVGDVSDPVRTAFGWHLIRLDEDNPGVVRTDETFREPRYREWIQEVYETEKMETFVARLIEKARVRRMSAEELAKLLPKR